MEPEIYFRLLRRYIDAKASLVCESGDPYEYPGMIAAMDEMYARKIGRTVSSIRDYCRDRRFQAEKNIALYENRGAWETNIPERETEAYWQGA